MNNTLAYQKKIESKRPEKARKTFTAPPTRGPTNTDAKITWAISRLILEKVFAYSKFTSLMLLA